MTWLEENFAPNLVFHTGVGSEMDTSFNDLKQFFSGLFDAFPDCHYTLDDILVEGDKSVVRYTVTGTHKGAFMGVPPTNKKVVFWEIDIYRFANGKLVEGWGRFDTLGFMQQLGVIPTPEKK
jgi:hypothetical protein